MVLYDVHSWWYPRVCISILGGISAVKASASEFLAVFQLPELVMWWKEVWVNLDFRYFGWNSQPASHICSDVLLSAIIIRERIRFVCQCSSFPPIHPPFINAIPVNIPTHNYRKVVLDHLSETCQVRLVRVPWLTDDVTSFDTKCRTVYCTQPAPLGCLHCES